MRRDEIGIPRLWLLCSYETTFLVAACHFRLSEVSGSTLLCGNQANNFQLYSLMAPDRLSQALATCVSFCFSIDMLIRDVVLQIISLLQVGRRLLEKS